jgi:1,6-anhydro-N-acetylmuramate kinase
VPSAEQRYGLVPRDIPNAELVAFTAQSLLALWKHLPEAPLRVIACGGGTRNPTLMRVLSETLPCPVESAGSRMEAVRHGH